jgi:hypothetical protein
MAQIYGQKLWNRVNYHTNGAAKLWNHVNYHTNGGGRRRRQETAGGPSPLGGGSKCVTVAQNGVTAIGIYVLSYGIT